MKKVIYLVVIIFLFLSCKSQKLYSGLEYRILKIDSLDSVYLIYAEKDDISIGNSNVIKIVSAKSENRCKRNQLVIGKNYKLNLTSLYPENFASHHLNGINYNGVLVKFDKDYNVRKDLFTADHLNGLCYIYK